MGNLEKKRKGQIGLVATATGSAGAMKVCYMGPYLWDAARQADDLHPVVML